MSETPRKLVEVALPLEEINVACKADKDRKTGTIRNLHKWFAPMPLPAWRALLYAALIDDPGDDDQRLYHLDVIKRLVANGADMPDPATVTEARDNLARQFPGGIPVVMDPFCGGGSTLVEAQRLGLETFGSDLNPVPALITRTLTSILPGTYGLQPLHVDNEVNAPQRVGNAGTAQSSLLDDSRALAFPGYEGLALDVQHYANVVLDAVANRVQHLFPINPGESPIAWLWARTAICPNPACKVETILSTSWWLSKKKGDLAWLVPTVRDGQIHLEVVQHQTAGEAPPEAKVGNGVFACCACQTALDGAYLRSEGAAGRLGLRMTAVVVEHAGGREYREPSVADLEAATDAANELVDLALPSLVGKASISLPLYGMSAWDAVFTSRQLILLDAFSDEVAKVHSRVLADGGSPEWGVAISTVLGLAVGQVARSGSSQCLWRPRPTAHSKAESAFGRNDLPMMWDFGETYFRGGSVGDWMSMVTSMTRAFDFVAPGGQGVVQLGDARSAEAPRAALIATDPPYFDAVGYADLSDYFYAWHRRALRDVHPDLYTTLAAPKAGELVALPSHHENDKERARTYFIEGFTEAFRNLKKSMHPDVPMLIVYASKEQKGGREEETRWSSILTAMLAAELEITATWPIHGTSAARMISAGANAVASYVVMAVRTRPASAPSCSLQDFNRLLRRELKPAVNELQSAGILPVDLAQAALGPGMQVYSRYRSVLDQTGERVPVELALRLINQALSEVLDEQEGDLDPNSRFAVTWWEKYHWGEGSFGEADQLARPQGISVEDLVRAHVAEFPRAGFVRLLGSDPLDRDWNPSLDSRPTAWEAVHHLSDRLIDGGGVVDAGRLMGHLGVWRDQAQALVYRLHAIAARHGWTKDQERYNALIASWSDLLAEAGRVHESRDGLF